MAKSRLVGSYPVIGIRPTIDGRRGALDVRGSLEEQTMNMGCCQSNKHFKDNRRIKERGNVVRLRRHGRNNNV